MSNDDRLATDREWLVNQIAHALRNPIFAASVHTESLMLRADDSAAVAKTAEALSGQLERLSRNIDEMLLFGRPIQASPSEVGVAEILESLAVRYRIGGRSDPAEIALEPVDRSAKGIWDREAVIVILERILDNAVEHTAPPHEIRLAARTNDAGEVVLSVSDEGEGIPPSVLEKALLPFFPQHSGRPGLGLAIADKFARFLGGRIEIDSSEGAGTVVRCILPPDSDTASL